jgi:hypothetical protein
VVPAKLFASTPTVPFDFGSLPYSADWGLTGNWILKNIPGTITSGTGGIIPLALSDLNLGTPDSQSDPASYWLQRADGSYVNGAFNPIYANITAAPFDRTVTLGDSATVTKADLAAGCTVTVSDTCDPTVSISALPAGAVTNPDGSFTCIASAAGKTPFTYTLTDAARGISTNATGNLHVDAVVVTPPVVTPPVVTPPAAPTPPATPAGPVVPFPGVTG